MYLSMKYWFNFHYLRVVTAGWMWARNRETSPWWKSVHERFRTERSSGSVPGQQSFEISPCHNR